MDTYVFPCLFIYEEDGISVIFPDLDGCVSFGEDEQKAFYNAKEALTLHLYGMEQDRDPIPAPSKAKGIKPEENEQIVFIEAYMTAFRAKQENKYVKKTLTIPEWLNIVGEKEGVNFSQLLQTALKEKLKLA